MGKLVYSGRKKTGLVNGIVLVDKIGLADEIDAELEENEVDESDIERNLKEEFGICPDAASNLAPCKNARKKEYFDKFCTDGRFEECPKQKKYWRNLPDG